MEEGIVVWVYANAMLFPVVGGFVSREPSVDNAPSFLDVHARTAAELVPRGSASSPSVGVRQLNNRLRWFVVPVKDNEG